MTNPNPGGIRTTQPNGQALNMPWVTCQVISIDMGNYQATVIDSMSRQIPIRLDIQRAKGQLPEVGERWIIDKTYGVWTFAALLGANTKGAITPIENVPDLAPTLVDHQAQMDNNAAIVAGMQLTLSITNVQGTSPTNKRYVDGTLSDGTTVTGVPCAGSYYPMVGDTAWVLRQGVTTDANSTPQLIAIGKAGVVAGAPFGQGTVTRAQIVAESQMWLLADRRLTAPAGGGVYQITRGQTDSSGNLIYNSLIDTTVAGANNNALERNNVLGIGLLWNAGSFSFTTADGTGTVPVNMAGWTAQVSSTGRPSLIASGQGNVGICAADGTVYVTTNVTTTHAPLVASALTSDTTVTSNGLITSSIKVGTAPAPAANQIQTVDITANNNLAVAVGFYYKGVLQNMNPASERELKRNIRLLDDPFDYLMKLAPSRYYWIDTEYFDADEHVGVIVNEMDDADPATVQHPPLVIEPGIKNDVASSWRANHGRHPDERALIAYLVRAVQKLRSELDELSNGS